MSYRLTRVMEQGADWKTVIEVNPPSAGVDPMLLARLPARFETLDNGTRRILNSAGAELAATTPRPPGPLPSGPATEGVPFSRTGLVSSVDPVARRSPGRAWADFILVSPSAKARILARLDSVPGARRPAGGSKTVLSTSKAGAVTEVVVDTSLGRIEELRTAGADGTTSTTTHTYTQSSPESGFLSRSEHVTRDRAGTQVGPRVIVTYTNHRLVSRAGGS
jgi:hypothetical protein